MHFSGRQDIPIRIGIYKLDTHVRLDQMLWICPKNINHQLKRWMAIK